MKTRSISALLVVALAATLTGCVAFVPPLSNKLVAGRVIKKSEVGFIVPRKTTRMEGEQQLGPCSRRSFWAPSVAYSWERPGWTVFWCGPYDSGSFEASGWHALFVAFDDHGIVLQKDFVNLSDLSSLDEHLERWAERVRKKKMPAQ